MVGTEGGQLFNRGFIIQLERKEMDDKKWRIPPFTSSALNLSSNKIASLSLLADIYLAQVSGNVQRRRRIVLCCAVEENG